MRCAASGVARGSNQCVREVYHGVREVYPGVREVYYGVREVYHGAREVYLIGPSADYHLHNIFIS